MNYLDYMKKKTFMWKGTLVTIVLYGGIIQAISAIIFGEKVFWMEELILFAIVIGLYFSNGKYNNLVNNAIQQYACYNADSSFFLRILSRGITRHYFCFISYEFNNKTKFCITTVIGQDELVRFKNLLEKKPLPIARSYDGKKCVFLIQEFFEAHGFHGQGIEEESYPICLLVYIPKIIIILLAIFAHFIY